MLISLNRQQAVKRVGKCLGETIKVTRNFDSQSGVHCESGYHTTRSEEKDFGTLLKQLNRIEVFKEKEPRKHTSFSKMKPNLIMKLDMKDVGKWMEYQ